MKLKSIIAYIIVVLCIILLVLSYSKWKEKLDSVKGNALNGHPAVEEVVWVNSNVVVSDSHS
ncbi:hypothetical protein ACXYMX_15565 [Sporosarcina sp. CAU 1771]